MKKKLPKVLYVRWNESLDEPWLEASTDPNAFAEANEKFQVGKYEMTEIGTVEAVPRYLRAGKR